MLRKIMFRVWAGPWPAWKTAWEAHVAPLRLFGWDFVLVPAEVAFMRRRRLGLLDLPLPPGTRKAGDLDPTLGVLFDDYIAGYDFWGHVGLDTVLGRVERFLPDSRLGRLDVFGNDRGAICGPFSIYRNVPKVNQLFTRVGENGPVRDHIGREFKGWRELLLDPDITGWDEGAFSDVVAAAGKSGEIRFESGFYQAHDKQPGHLPRPRITIEPDGTLRDLSNGQETMMFHFNRKDVPPVWPVNLPS